jgi:hypothetical protein
MCEGGGRGGERDGRAFYYTYIYTSIGTARERQWVGKFIRDGTPDRWEYPQHLQGREGGWHLRETMARSFPEDGGDPSELARHGIVHAEGLEEVGVLPPCVSSGGEAMIVCAMG